LDLHSLQEEYWELYTVVLSQGAPLSILALSFPISDSLPTIEEIAMAVKSLRHWQGPGLSGFCTEDLQEWLEALEETFGPMLPLRVNRVSSPMDDDNLSPWDTWWSDFVNFS